MEFNEMEEPPPGDRRHGYRRETDREQATIVDGAVHDAPIVTRLLRTGRIAGAMLAIGAVFGGVLGGILPRFLWPSDELKAQVAQVDASLNRRIDSTVHALREVKQRQDSILAGQRRVESAVDSAGKKLEFQAYTLCILIRRFAGDVRPPGCDAAERRGGHAP